MATSIENSESAPLLAVIDYGMGNLRSVANAFEKVGARVRIVHRAGEQGEADALILPGVGALGDCTEALRNTGLDDTVRGWIGEDRPFFGICLGLQCLFEKSEEGGAPGLSVFPGQVRRFQLPPHLKVPHMGWNTVRFRRSDLLLEGLAPDRDQYYFVHSYYVDPEDGSLAWAETDYGGPFVSAIQRGNCFATQFHPEKSQAKGLRIYHNFVQYLRPECPLTSAE